MLTIPNVLSMVITLLYDLADTYFIAAVCNTDLVAGVSLCAPVLTVQTVFGNVFAQGRDVPWSHFCSAREKRRELKMHRKMENQNIAEDIEAVVTSYNQGSMILEAVSSLCDQTMLPAGIIIVDDGSTEKHSLEILDEIASDPDLPVPVTVLYQSNGGVSAARKASSY